MPVHIRKGRLVGNGPLEKKKPKKPSNTRAVKKKKPRKKNTARDWGWPAGTRLKRGKGKREAAAGAPAGKQNKRGKGKAGGVGAFLQNRTKLGRWIAVAPAGTNGWGF